MKVRLLLNDPQNSYNPSPLIDILAPLGFKRFQLPAIHMAVNAWQKHVGSNNTAARRRAWLLEDFVLVACKTMMGEIVLPEYPGLAVYRLP